MFPPDGEPRDLQVDDLTDSEVVELMTRVGNPLSDTWREFRSAMGTIEQAQLQGTPIGIIELRRLELECVVKIMRAAGVGVRSA